jgi:hypothetical protein
LNSYPEPETELTEIQQHRVAEFEITDDLQDLLSVLPPHIADQIVELQRQEDLGGIIEIVLDLGRSPEARFQFDEVSRCTIAMSRGRISTSSPTASVTSGKTIVRASSAPCIGSPRSGIAPAISLA